MKFFVMSMIGALMVSEAYKIRPREMQGNTPSEWYKSLINYAEKTLKIAESNLTYKRTRWTLHPVINPELNIGQVYMDMARLHNLVTNVNLSSVFEAFKGNAIPDSENIETSKHHSEKAWKYAQMALKSPLAKEHEKIARNYYYALFNYSIAINKNTVEIAEITLKMLELKRSIVAILGEKSEVFNKDNEISFEVLDLAKLEGLLRSKKIRNEIGLFFLNNRDIGDELIGVVKRTGSIAKQLIKEVENLEDKPELNTGLEAIIGKYVLNAFEKARILQQEVVEKQAELLRDFLKLSDIASNASKN